MEEEHKEDQRHKARQLRQVYNASLQPKEQMKSDEELLAKSYYYLTAEGKILTVRETRKLFSQAANASQKQALIEQIASWQKVYESTEKGIQPVPKPNYPKPTKVTAKSFVNDYNDLKLRFPTRPPVQLIASQSIVRMPALQAFTQTLPYLYDSKIFQDMLADFKDLEVRVVVYKNRHGQKVMERDPNAKVKIRYEETNIIEGYEPVGDDDEEVVMKPRFKVKRIDETPRKPLVCLLISFPSPDFLSQNKTIPVYFFKQETIPADFSFLYRFRKRLAYGKIDITELDIYNKMCDFTRKWCYSAGTVPGMLARISIMEKARQDYAKNRQTRTDDKKSKYWLSYQSNLVYFWPTTEYNGPDLDTYDIEAILSRPYYSKKEEEEIKKTGIKVEPTTYFHRKVNAHSSSGPWYSKVKTDLDDPNSLKVTRKETAWQEPLIASWMMQDMYLREPTEKEKENADLFFIKKEKLLHQIHNSKTDNSTKLAAMKGLKLLRTYERKNQEIYLPHEFFNYNSFFYKWESIVAFNCFPKSDPYELAKLDDKTRCIASYNNAPMLPVELVMTPLADNLISSVSRPVFWTPGPNKKLVHEERGSLIMNKFTPFHGGMKRYVDIYGSLRKRPVGTIVFMLYADNLYILQRYEDMILAASLDAEKSESAIQTNNVAAVLNLAASKMNVDLAYVEYFNNVFPQLAINGVAIIANTQLKFPAMGSGVQGTFYFNSAKMTELILHFTENSTNPFVLHKDPDNKDNYIFSKEFKASMKSVGYNQTIEFVETLALDQKLPKTLQLDLLGYHMVLFEFEGGRLPCAVLRENSLFGLLLFNKKYYDHNGKCILPLESELFLKLIKLRTAILQGVWAYPGLFENVMLDCIKFHTVFKKLVGDVIFDSKLSKEEVIAFLYPEPEEEDPFYQQIESMFSLLCKPEVPTLFEIVSLQTKDAPLKKQIVGSYLEVWPLHWLASSKYLNENFGITVEDYETVVMTKPKKLLQMFPDLKGSHLTQQKAKARVLQKPTQIDVSKNKQKIQPITRTYATVAVGKPLELENKNYSAIKLERKPEVFQVFVDWLNHLAREAKERGGIVPYRVPIPAEYVGRENEIIEEFHVARRVVADAIRKQTGYGDQEIYSLLDQFVKPPIRVEWIVKPISPNNLLKVEPNSFETHGLLIPGYIINRRFTKETQPVIK